MPCSLTNHPQQYWLSPKEICLTALGFTGAPYAGRHLEQSRQESPWTTSRMAHRAIFLIECMPIVGGCVALAEGIFHACFKSSSPIVEEEAKELELAASVGASPLSPEEPASPAPETGSPASGDEEHPVPEGEKSLPDEEGGMTGVSRPMGKPSAKDPIQRMHKNLQKAVQEAWKREIEAMAYVWAHHILGTIRGDYGNQSGASEDQILMSQCRGLEESIQKTRRALEEASSLETPYMQLSELPIPPTDTTQKEPIPLVLPTKIAKEQRFDKSTKHAEFYLKIGNTGTLAGIFKGHNGKEVAQFASDEFQKNFPDALKRAEGNVHAVFENMIAQIQRELATHPEWNNIGSTAVICYIDKETHLIYTATIGEGCQANIYRMMGKKKKSITLYLERSWLSKHDRARLTAAFSEKEVTQHIRRQEVAKLGLFLKGTEDFQVSHAISSRLSEGTHHSRAFGHVDDPLVIPKPKVTVFKLQNGDTFTLSSGLTDFLSEEAIVSIISSEEGSPHSALVQAALKKMFEPQHKANMTKMRKQRNVTVRVFKVLHLSKK